MLTRNRSLDSECSSSTKKSVSSSLRIDLQVQKNTSSRQKVASSSLTTHWEWLLSLRNFPGTKKGAPTYWRWFLGLRKRSSTKKSAYSSLGMHRWAQKISSSTWTQSAWAPRKVLQVHWEPLKLYHVLLRYTKTSHKLVTTLAAADLLMAPGGKMQLVSGT